MPYDADHLAGEIAAYSAADAAQVSARIRRELSIEACVGNLVKVYEEAAGSEAHADTMARATSLRTDYARLIMRWPKLALAEYWWRIPRSKRDSLKQRRIVAGVYRLLRPKDTQYAP